MLACVKIISSVYKNKHSRTTHIDVPQFAAGLPMMILSDTPRMLSVLPYAEASNK